MTTTTTQSKRRIEAQHGRLAAMSITELRELRTAYADDRSAVAVLTAYIG
jgi:hypothetical protein